MGGIPWCPEAEEVYGQLRGRKLRDDWKLLFTEGEGYEEVRLAYWQILGDILSDAFYKPVNQWCEAHGKRYTAHLKGEETLFFQTSCSGSLYQNLKPVSYTHLDVYKRQAGERIEGEIIKAIRKLIIQNLPDFRIYGLIIGHIRIRQRKNLFYFIIAVHAGK